MSDQRNLILAIVLSVAILLGFDLFINKPQRDREEARQQQLAEQSQQTAQSGTEPAAPGSGVVVPGAPSVPGAAPTSGAVPGTALVPGGGPSAAAVRAATLDKSPRVSITTPSLLGSIALTGSRIDDLTLRGYHEELDTESPEIVLLSPAGSSHPYYAEFGWAANETGLELPGPDTPWQADRRELTPGSPVTLTWQNDQGLEFTRTIAIDRNYMFTVNQRVVNAGSKAVTLYPWGIIARTGTPDTLGFYILHEGLLGVFNETLKEVDYDDLVDDETVEEQSTGGWIGITDKYWLAALVPNQKEAMKAGFRHSLLDKKDKYQVDFLGAARALVPGASVEVTNHLFAGAKQVHQLERYQEVLGISRFDLVIDWGWFPFLTKPIFIAIDYFNRVLGNFGLAILLFTVLMRILFFPLANKSFRSMGAMKKLQPEMVKMKERFGSDKAKLNQAMMELYKKEKVNPMAGCLPIALQIPVFFALYKVLFVTIEMRHAPFYGWIHDLSAPDPTNFFTLLGLIPWDPPQMLHLGVWPLAMGISMFLQQKLNPPPADPVQAKVFMMLPIVFTFLLANFPAGLVIYWTWNNVLSMAQQWVIQKRVGTAPAAAKKT
ncbi:MAG: membrane protein insertase YidC [Alphaproteobacteria bacterium]|jgi:YidC/Oxa1 family membrane protein insertase|nr:membrane protein insertase YidC [Rhodospirillaceae bacterium]MDP6405967.1 membrane protein insertase YidC [Alphaproteobacteria bacterium]MDP6622250.1 membrane protein insertase YidC [Alphaproteobacteria bacterium]